jgi:cytochrome c-type biogenesis protein CcmH
MVFFALSFAIALLFCGILIAFLLRRDASAIEGDAANRLGEALAEIDAAKDRGELDDDAAAEATLEAKRAALAMADDGAPHAKTSRFARLAAIAFVALAPLGVAGVYLSVGSPDWRERMIAPPAETPGPQDLAALPVEERRAMIETMVDGLSARMADTPTDIEGWRMLARSQMVLGRFEDSKASYRQLLALTAGDIEDWRNYATVYLGDEPEGAFPTTPDFINILDEIEARSENDPFVLFYRAGAAREMGDPARAAALWRQLLERVPAEAPVRPAMQQLIDEADALAAATAEKD